MPSVLITGTSKGIGFEAALAFARAGYQVHATMRNPAGAPDLAATAAQEKLPILVSTLDVDADASVKDGIAAILRNHGPIDVLVNNAGIERAGSVEELPLDDFRAVMETNYFGVIRCVKAVAASMRERRSGCIINVSSLSGLLSNPPLSAYCASKYALEAFSEALAGEMKTFGVRVALVEPGIIDTAMARRLGDEAASTLYPQRARLARLFAAVLQQPEVPSTVANLILEIAQSGTWQLRHLAGPAGPFLGWRRAMTDEDWVTLNASDDDIWYSRIERDFGMKTRPE